MVIIVGLNSFDPISVLSNPYWNVYLIKHIRTTILDDLDV